MKKIFKYLLVTVFLSSMFYSCETTELELLASPNALSPEQADPNYLFNTVQINYMGGVRSLNNIGAQVSRIDYMLGSNYFSNYSANTMGGAWSSLYSGMIPDIAIIESLHSDDVNLSFQIGASKIMEAHMLMLLVDFVGDIPYSQTNNPVEFPFPIVDSGSDVYNSAISLLDEAIVLLDSVSDAGSATDFYYDGDISKWTTLANTLKMRADLTMGNYQNVIDATGYMTSNADDLEFKFGTQDLNPNTRHGDYNSDYTDSGANIYQSNWLMNLMVGPGGDASPETDPRRRYYFYRQIWRTHGNTAFLDNGNEYLADGDGETLGCSISDTPTHLEFTPDENIWCSLPLGYWGRMHGNPEGTPPDNFTRTAVGVYPAGGSFDGNADLFPLGDNTTFAQVYASYGQQVGLGNGGSGQGVEPLLLASYVQFWLAEANFMLGNDGSANLQAGLEMSIAKVQSFGSLDATADFSQAPDATVVSDFISLKVNEFNAASDVTSVDANGYPVNKDKLDILGEQFFVSMYGGAADAYNFVRRTGYPRTLSRAYQANIDTFPRTFLYPSSETSPNPNINQKTDFSTTTFWDAGVVNPAN